MKRLKLIWFALTAPSVALEKRIDEVQSGWHWAINRDILRELDSLNVNKWELVGVSLAHSSEDVDSTAIHQFLKRAPAIIRRMIEREENDDATFWRYK